MKLIDGKIAYAPRVSPGLIIRLYQSDAQGLRDEELADEVGTALFARCEDILAVSQQHRSKCPLCGRWVEHSTDNSIKMCCSCGFSMSWRDYTKSYKNKGLKGSGALPVFERYLQQYAAARQYTDKILAIDSMIHAFHFELQGNNRLCRPAATCVIHSFEAEILRILNALAYSQDSSAGLAEGYASYQSKLCRSSVRGYAKK